jgi:hypothetical protein
MKTQHTIILLLCLVLCGCATNKFSETITESSEGGKPITTATEHKSKVFWPPFAKTGPTGSDFSYTWGGPENKIISGQKTDAVDTTPQTEAIQAIGNVLGQIVAEIVKTYLTAQTAGAASVVAP